MAMYYCDSCSCYLNDDEEPMTEVDGEDICPDCLDLHGLAPDEDD